MAFHALGLSWKPQTLQVHLTWMQNTGPSWHTRLTLTDALLRMQDLQCAKTEAHAGTTSLCPWSLSWFSTDSCGTARSFRRAGRICSWGKPVLGHDLKQGCKQQPKLQALRSGMMLSGMNLVMEERQSLFITCSCQRKVMAACSATSKCQVNPKSCLVIVSVLLNIEIMCTYHIHDDILALICCGIAEQAYTLPRELPWRLDHHHDC